MFEIGGGYGWLGGLVSAALGGGFLGINAGLFPIPAIAIGPTIGVCSLAVLANMYSVFVS